LKHKVAIIPCATYNTKEVFQAVSHGIELLGGISSFINPGEKVLLKPNLLCGKQPEHGVSPHPSIVEAAIKLVKEARARAFLGDSPSLESLEKAAAIAGIKDVVNRNSAELVEFKHPVPINPPSNATFKRIELASEALSVDAIINIPKVKTHAQMLLTLAIKNLFGCVIGKRKARWHLQIGAQEEKFAELLVDIYHILQPRLTIVDGIMAMEGNGPGSGTMRPLGVIIISNNCLAADMVITQLVGLKYTQLSTNRAAFRKGLKPSTMNEIEILGDSIEKHMIKDFILPRSMNVAWNIPNAITQRLKRSIGNFPKVNKDKCSLCRLCEEVCPAGAMRQINGSMQVDYDKCISCFCCQENCPQGTIGVKQGWLLRLLHMLRIN
jgi:uncharacterized protein (DUF362 family)/Pyruvate/2-oxoacid:ferredoxin oxidoreductase delta subunit